MRISDRGACDRDLAYAHRDLRDHLPPAYRRGPRQ